jgi:hypothetical protein
LLLRLLFLFLIIFILFFAVKAYLAGRKSVSRRGSEAPDGEEMVLDPQCQSYVPKREAVMQEGKYFCSQECAKLYLAR